MTIPTLAIVLTANPAKGLSDDVIRQASAQLGEAEAHRLSDSAAELFTTSDTLPALEGVDVNRVPFANRRKKLLIADMDSTMIPVECIDEVADFAGVREQVVAITEPAMRGEMSFTEALHRRVELMAGLPESKLQEVFDQRVSLNPGARKAVQTMRANGAYCALVSGGFTFFTERVANLAGFNENQANTLLIEGGKLTGKVSEPVLGRQAKIEALEEITARLGITPKDALAVGDGANDLGMIGVAGLGVAYHAKPIVAKAADAAINHGDLTALLYLQGYRDTDFVT